MIREQIWGAVWAILSSAPGFVTRSRTLRHWSDVPNEQQPALYLAQGPEQRTTTTGQPPIVKLTGTVYVYASGQGDRSPAEVLNPLLDAIEGLFPLNPNTLRHELYVEGVGYCRIEGAIETFEGTLGDQEVALIPISILVT